MMERKLSTADLVPEEDQDRIETPSETAFGNGAAKNAPVETGNGLANGAAKALPQAPLFEEREAHDFRSKWDEIQIRFVDDPKKATADADSLVAEAMRRLAEIFSNERKNMEEQWSRGDNVSTEDLRVALQRYRSFFNRLLMI